MQASMLTSVAGRGKVAYFVSEFAFTCSTHQCQYFEDRHYKRWVTEEGWKSVDQALQVFHANFADFGNPVRASDEEFP
jgi:hypothetical protein